MAPKAVFAARRDEERIDRIISCIKYTLFCLNIVGFLVGAALFGMCIWMRKDPGMEDWVTRLDLWEFYSGVYVLLAASVIVLVTTFVGCCSALTENQQALHLFAGAQALCFVVGLAGSAVLLDYSTYNSHIQPILRRVFRQLIMNSQYEDVSYVLNQVQESVSCCGADGAADYLQLRKPLPSECRDTVTGNAFFYGCVEELTWFLEERAAWVAGIAMTLCFSHVVNAVLALLLVKALRQEENRS
ncbi:Tetraspanin-2A [Frankliniella fusca]|uniref:Tetraspanin n=1 Tax=Frankliniella fusca TaxID=407009 RepID=A0AAE1H696_9NEOP|nr:Tetraspanin-2A [Frankliniella fusca]